MPDGALLLDTNIVIKHLLIEDESAAATRLVEDALARQLRLVAPTLAWAEVGSVLRQRVMRRELLAADADDLWEQYLALSIDFVDPPDLRSHAWRIARSFGLPTIYDAAFLATAEVLGEGVEFWTADRRLLRRLEPRPPYVRELGA